MPKTLRFLAAVVASATALIGISAPSTQAAVAAPNTVISGTLAGTLTQSNATACPTWGVAGGSDVGPECAAVVIGLLTDGRVFRSTATGSKSFRLVVKADATARQEMTLHLMRADGSYVGPVVLSASGVVSISPSAPSLPLGRVTVRKVGPLSGFATATVPLSIRGTTKVRMVAGGPAGAGRAGLVRMPGAARSLSRTAVQRGQVDLTPCMAWGDKPMDNALPQECYDILVQLLPDMATICPAESTVGLTLIDFPADCVTYLQANLGGNNNGGGGEDCSTVKTGVDSDSDGVPDAIDVDDDGDLIVDTADTNTSAACAIEPTTGIRVGIGRGLPLNYGSVVNGYIPANEFDAMVDDYIGSGFFSIGYYVFQPKMFPSAMMDSDGLMPAAWVSCPGVVWCDPTTSRAINDVNVEMRNAWNAINDETMGMPGTDYFMWDNPANESRFSGGADWMADACATNSGRPCWSSIVQPMRFGSLDANCNSLPYDTTYARPFGVPAGARNFMWQQICNENGAVRSVMGASISPNLNMMVDTVSARDALSAQDVLTLNYLDVNGKVAGVATSLGAYPITAPMMTRVITGEHIYAHVGNTGGFDSPGSEQNPFALSSNGDFKVTFIRPQRPKLDGERGGTAGYHDMYGLNYGIQIELGNALIGCGPGDAMQYDPQNPNIHSVGGSSYVFTGMNMRTDTGTMSTWLTPLADTAVADPNGPAGVKTLTFSVNLRDCLAERLDFLNATYWANAPTPVTLQDFVGPEPLVNHPSINKNGLGCIPMSLAARGVDRTGGTNSALQEFCLTFDPNTWPN